MCQGGQGKETWPRGWQDTRLAKEGSGGSAWSLCGWVYVYVEERLPQGGENIKSTTILGRVSMSGSPGHTPKPLVKESCHDDPGPSNTQHICLSVYITKAGQCRPTTTTKQGGHPQNKTRGGFDRRQTRRRGFWLFLIRIRPALFCPVQRTLFLCVWPAFSFGNAWRPCVWPCRQMCLGFWSFALSGFGTATRPGTEARNNGKRSTRRRSADAKPRRACHPPLLPKNETKADQRTLFLALCAPLQHL